MKDCYGEEKYQDGSVYIGEFKKNMKNGNGNLILGGTKAMGTLGDSKRQNFRKKKI